MSSETSDSEGSGTGNVLKSYNNELLNDCAWFAEKHRGNTWKTGPHWSTIIRFTPLFDEAVRLQKRVDTLEAYIADYQPKENK